MNETCVGFLHPGEMGSALAKLVQMNGYRTCWTAGGRTARTLERARIAGMEQAESLAELCQRCAVIVSVCPPHAALQVAGQVAEIGFSGIFIDANATSPAHARELEYLLAEANARFVDAAIIGPPPISPSTTTLYLSGPHAQSVERYFSGGNLDVRILGRDAGQSSALKMCHSAVTKGQLALIFASLAAAEHLGVRDELVEAFLSRESTSSYVRSMGEQVRRTAKAWRFAGEMHEIASTFQAAGLPGGFHLAAGDIFERLSAFEHTSEEPDLAQVLASLVRCRLPAGPRANLPRDESTQTSMESKT